MLGRYTPAQVEAFRPYVVGQDVHDLGSGAFLDESRMLLEMGARSVVAVDKEQPLDGALNLPRLTIVQSYFVDYKPAEIPVAFLSWPVNYPSDVHPLLERAPVVIYTGKNTDMAACGYPAMWKTLVAREVLVHVPERRNVLIVYGPRRLIRPGLPEEYAALHQDGLWSYDAIHLSFGMGDVAGVNASLVPPQDAAAYTGNKTSQYRELYKKRRRRG